MKLLAEPNTAAGNRNFVRLLLNQKDQAFARTLNAAVTDLSRTYAEHELALGYDAEQEFHDWLVELRRGPGYQEPTPTVDEEAS